MLSPPITIIGAGLAGSEAAWALAEAGREVVLYEMRPHTATPAHRTGSFAELVCSNSFRSDDPANAVGCLKCEMRDLHSLTMLVAAETSVPAGSGLAVDRDGFAAAMTERLSTHPRITVRREEVKSLADIGYAWNAAAQAAEQGHAGDHAHDSAPLLIASGPLTAAALAAEIAAHTGTDDLYFYDSMAPLIATESIDQSFTFRASRYGKGAGDEYINLPLTRAEYEAFVAAVVAAEKVPPRAFEDPKYFEGCLPIEVMAERGPETLRHGPMKPMGLPDPRTGKTPYAVVQLRQDNREGTIFNMVGFQTRMTWGEQKRIFTALPGLAHADFLRLGAMHRNTYINSPRLLDATLQWKGARGIHFAGQLVGVEGYVESAAMGLYVGHHLAGRITAPPPETTALGSLIRHVSAGNPARFEPMNANWGLTPPLPPTKYRERKNAYLARARADFANWLAGLHSRAA